ncbi:MULTISPECIES: DUF6339 family protein [Geobacillus]|nr:MULTISPECIES: DUF6339 family protein [Geobacillus]ARP43135.1 hypothetical protein GTHT12_01600 [Geobacillus thermodenitrificans]MED3907374.1 DUF6339 family protein [Geobacillus thermodenitrificans]MED4918048.1 DUF6339 family protein [Geobacillus thermodenitrificans]WMV74913.1 DUF6339 family protein [Geobacillus thermodenitrificans]
MRLKFISDEALMDLRGNYDSYKEHYYNEDHEWFDNYFKEEGKVLESNIQFEVPVLNMETDYAISDKENVKVIYEALKHLTVNQATQEKLWAGLAHLQLREFAFYRLKKDLESKNDKRINTALFFKNGNKRSLFVHILARLWWVGYMTYDESNKQDPYWLTNFFCSKDFSARSVIFFSSNFTSNRTITKGILKCLVGFEENGIEIKRDHFVQANKYLNIVGGAMILDMLTEEEVKEMVEKYLLKYFGYKLDSDKVHFVNY